MEKNILFISLSAILLFARCANETKSRVNNTEANAIYFGGDIITMQGDTATYAEALAVKGGKIIFVGTKTEADKLKGDSTVLHDLQGKTLLPGFIDGHSHFISAMSMTSQANCFAAPAGNANDVEGIIASLKDLQKRKNYGKGEIIVGYGYDENQMPGGRDLNRDDLDKAFPDNPVIVIHVSQHG